MTISHPDCPLLVVDMADQPGRSFRSAARELYMVESNLAEANMDWEDFAGHVDGEGIHQGFGE